MNPIQLSSSLWVCLAVAGVTTHYTRIGFPWPVDVLLSLPAVLLGFRARIDRPAFVRVLLFASLYALFIGPGILSTALGIYTDPSIHHKAWIECVKLSLRLPLTAALIALFSRQRSFIRLSLDAWTALMTLQTTLCFSEFGFGLLSGHFPGWFTSIIEDQMRFPAFSGLALEPNVYCAMLLPAILHALGSALFAPSRRTFRGFATLYAFLLAGAFLGQTRSAWLALATSVGGAFLYTIFWPGSPLVRLNVRKLLGLHLALAFAAALAGVALWIKHDPMLLGMFYKVRHLFGESASGSVTVRRTIYASAWADTPRLPILGKGLLSYPPHFMTEGWVFSSLLQTLHDNGIIALLALFALTVWGIVAGLPFFASTSALHDRSTGLTVFFGNLGLLGISQFSSVAWTSFFWYFLALSISYYGKFKSDPHHSVTIPRISAAQAASPG